MRSSKWRLFKVAEDGFRFGEMDWVKDDIYMSLLLTKHVDQTANKQ